MISEIPISVILTLLENPKAGDVQYVLGSLYSCPSTVTKASKSEINHLTSRILNLLNSNDDYKKWVGTHLIQVLGSNPIILTNDGQAFIVALLKIINDLNTIPINLKNASLSLDVIIKNIRGKPVLTREILTPNLPSIISSLIDKMDKDLVSILPILRNLILKNTTTFKPFLNKFESKLITLLNNENFSSFNVELKKEICSNFAYVNLISSNSNQQQQKNGQVQSLPDDQWRIKIFQILSELSSVIKIYNNLIELNDEKELIEILNKMSSKYSDSKNFIFGYLKIDLINPISILSISKRIDILVQLLIAFITSPTPFPVRIPLSLIIQTSNVLTSLSLNYIPFKKELNNNETLKNIITNDISKSQLTGINLIHEISINFKKLILPNLKSILSSFEVIIPIEKKNKNSKVIKINEEFCLSIENVLLTLIKTTTELLSLSNGLNDYDLINKLIDVSILFLQEKKPLDGLLDKQEIKQNLNNTNNKNNKKNKKKNKDSTPLADILSHSELFELNPSNSTVLIIYSFFEIILKKISKISINSRLKIVKYLISQAVRQNSNQIKINSKLTTLLEIIVLYPGEGEVHSFLPIIKTLLPNNEKLSLLTNPRLPPLDTKYNPKKEIIEEEEEEEDEEDDELPEPEQIPEPEKFLEEFKPESKPVTKQETIFKTDEEVKTLQFAKKEAGEAKAEKAEAEEAETKELKKVRTHEDESEEDTPSKRIKIVQEPIKPQEVKVTVDEESSDGEFEIPDIEIDSDDE